MVKITGRRIGSLIPFVILFTNKAGRAAKTYSESLHNKACYHYTS